MEETTTTTPQPVERTREEQTLLDSVRKVKAERKGNCGHVTCQLNLVHQNCGEQPHHVVTVYMEQLETETELYERKKYKVNADWEPLDMGWFSNKNNPHKLVVFKNLAPEVGRDLHLGIETEPGKTYHFATVRPGHHFACEPEATADIRLKSVNGPIIIHLIILPA